MKTVFIDVLNQKVKTLDIENELEVFYELINCRTIDMTMRKIGGKPYVIICDDEGLLTDAPILSAVNHNLEPMLVGNLIIVNNGKNGDITGLTEEDIKSILNNLYEIPTRQRPNGQVMLLCEY